MRKKLFSLSFIAESPEASTVLGSSQALTTYVMVNNWALKE